MNDFWKSMNVEDIDDFWGEVDYDMPFETKQLEGALERCESADDLKNYIFPILDSQKALWKEKINEILTSVNLKKSTFAELAGVSRVSLNKWENGLAVPRNRETYIRIGLIAGYSVEEVNHLLIRYGRFMGLYSKSLEDAICIFVISRNYGENAIYKYDELLNSIKSCLVIPEDTDYESASTTSVDRALAKIQGEEELKQFVNTNWEFFATAYNNLYSFILSYFEDGFTSADTFNSISTAQNWSSSLRQAVSAIRQGKWYPTRSKIISIGFHIGLDHNELDEMLEMAHMEPLCPKNVIESIIIFILEDAMLCGIIDETSTQYNPEELIDYAREVLEEFNIPEAEEFMQEVAE